jgi:hypothetical protein
MIRHASVSFETLYDPENLCDNNRSENLFLAVQSGSCIHS